MIRRLKMTIDYEAFSVWGGLFLLAVLGISKLYGVWYAWHERRQSCTDLAARRDRRHFLEPIKQKIALFLLEYIDVHYVDENENEVPIDAVAPDCNQLRNNEQLLFDDRVRAMVALVKAGQVANRATAIEAIFDCKRNGRPESTYGKAHAAITDVLNESPTGNYEWIAGPRSRQEDVSQSTLTSEVTQ